VSHFDSFTHHSLAHLKISIDHRRTTKMATIETDTLRFCLLALHQRIPSPRELQVHTQNILQRALIKKKLEEQQENYRKKQEMQQRGQSPSNNNNNNNNNNAQQPTKSVSSPTPLAFTPTSVLRKMTAEKDEGRYQLVDFVSGSWSGSVFW
jgi:hypothetical protein